MYPTKKVRPSIVQGMKMNGATWSNNPSVLDYERAQKTISLLKSQGMRLPSDAKEAITRYYSGVDKAPTWMDGVTSTSDGKQTLSGLLKLVKHDDKTNKLLPPSQLAFATGKTKPYYDPIRREKQMFQVMALDPDVAAANGGIPEEVTRVTFTSKYGGLKMDQLKVAMRELARSKKVTMMSEEKYREFIDKLIERLEKAREANFLPPLTSTEKEEVRKMAEPILRKKDDDVDDDDEDEEDVDEEERRESQFLKIPFTLYGKKLFLFADINSTVFHFPMHLLPDPFKPQNRLFDNRAAMVAVMSKARRDTPFIDFKVNIRKEGNVYKYNEIQLMASSLLYLQNYPAIQIVVKSMNMVFRAVIGDKPVASTETAERYEVKYISKVVFKKEQKAIPAVSI